MYKVPLLAYSAWSFKYKTRSPCGLMAGALCIYTLAPTRALTSMTPVPHLRQGEYLYVILAVVLA